MKIQSSYIARQCAVILAASILTSSAFQLPHNNVSRQRVLPSSSTSNIIQRDVTVLEMASNSGGGGSKRKRRKRKKVDATSTTTATPATATQDVVKPPTSSTIDTEIETKNQSAKAFAQELLAQEQMMFDEEDLTTFTPQKLEEDDRISAAAQRAGFSVTREEEGIDTELEDLFDSREFLQRKREKQLEDSEKQGKASSAIPTKKKIKRSDIKAYTKLLEMDPLADEDDSYFEDEGKIDVISALLGDVEPGVGESSDETTNKSGKKVQKKTSFLGIGSGPLQVGHTFGALSVILCAFVEYPGFPLTNLPDPLRGSLQGGLATIYLINAVLAVFSAMEAPSRNQSPILWGVKTFAVGGIAYDQLMQIPTPKELTERARKEEELLQRRQGRRGKRQK